ncbi:tolloid-like protein 2 isoform X2 [Gordionus sp. m RMFG-2023]|uniref:tolloid-like protein 2 isoform X2 n=1 Tax=Gordionus sp. m RMFG-2023 TaxID=3053472 RepID=UPI0031FD4243
MFVWLNCILFFLSNTLKPSKAFQNCDKHFLSSDAKRGNFSTPGYPNNYPNNIQCLYWFVAGKSEKVRISFKDFSYGGNMPECLHGYIDVYLQLENTDAELIDQYLDRRLCGMELPSDKISLHNIIVLGLYSDTHATEKGFLAHYEFIDATKYHIGKIGEDNFCGYTINGSMLPSGTIFSPTYPSVLTPNLNCYWKFLGLPGQRIKLNFSVINIEHGGDHCPYDSLEIYDGHTINALLIATLCGEMKDKVVFSSSKNVLIKFVTKESQRFNKTGFTAHFHFDDTIVNLDFISNPGYHIIGTECDQRILSLGETNGTMFSPMFPQSYKRNLDCFYYLKGLKDRRNLEKVLLFFQIFDIPNNSTRCSDAYLGVYYKHRDGELIDSNPDAKYCNLQPPNIISSSGHLLLLKFHSGNSIGNGFKIWYDFDTDFGIPGTPHPEKSKCDFTFMSSSQKSGSFNSPRHPANYPLKSSCLYIFKGLPGENIKLTFEHFKLPQKNSNNSDNMGDEERCALDYVKIYNVWSDEREDLLGIFCGEKSPFPIESENDVSIIKVEFHSGSNETAEGFLCQYSFVSLLDNKKQDCNHNFTAPAISGIVKTPNYPYKYQVSLTCDWFIWVKPQNRVLLTLINFILEGKLETGCSDAALLIWTNFSAPPKYLCGPKPFPNQSDYLSINNTIRLRFISSKRATGSKGFRVSWTEVMSNPICQKGYLCQKSNFCIDSSLRCNHISNCGSEDDSDEKYCSAKKGQATKSHVGKNLLLLCFLSSLIAVYSFNK